MTLPAGFAKGADIATAAAKSLATRNEIEACFAGVVGGLQDFGQLSCDGEAFAGQSQSDSAPTGLPRMDVVEDLGESLFGSESIGWSLWAALSADASI